MFEISIQKAWEQRLKDFGLGRMALFICFFNAFLFFIGGFYFQKFNLYILLPLPVSFAFYAYRQKIIEKGHAFILIMNAVFMNVAISYNYYMIGELDRMAGVLQRYDEVMWKFDLWVFKAPPALLIENVFQVTKIYSTFFYDSIIICYLLYYALPYLGGILYYLQLPKHLKYRVGRFCSNIVIYYSINYTLYFTIPVSGPQYYIRELFVNDLPFSWVGQWLYDLIKAGQLTYIDCFPSGHVGATFLVTFWLYKINHQQRFLVTLILIGVIFATIALRYHYVLYVLVSIPLAIFSYYISGWFYPAPVDVISLRRGAHER